MTALEGRAAVVTGAASGIGEATATLLAANGAAVVIADIDDDRAQHVAQRIVDAGGVARALHTDIGEEESIRTTLHLAYEEFGRLDILHNNAGANAKTLFSRDADLLDLDVEVWDRMMALNVRGTMLGCKHAIPLMLRGGGGSIVNTASAAALAGNVSNIAYAASKAAVLTLTKSVATAFGLRGVRCNAIAPGIVMTPGVAENVPDPLVYDMYREHVLVPRLGVPDDIAHAVLYLVGESGGYVNGQTLVVDGGLLAHMPYVAQARAMKQQATSDGTR